MLRSLDLFSGIGGFTWGLRDICSPVAYCEIDPTATHILQQRMSNGQLPHAPICPDVSRLDKDSLAGRGNVDIILAGFPCQGFSLMGHQTGYDHDGTSLYRHIVRLVSELRPALILLENVPTILCSGMHHVVHTLSKENGYELRWTVMGACDLGAPHMRRRWFCLAIRSDEDAQALVSRLSNIPCPDAFQWCESQAPPVMTLDQMRSRRIRCAALGNSVVPDCVRKAFHLLTQIPENDRPHCGGAKRRTWPIHGRCTPSLIVSQVTGYRLKRPSGTPPGRVFDPKLYTSIKPRSKLQTAPLIVQPVTSMWWMTPRHTNVSAANVLTQRTLRDLPSQVRFERATPDKLREGQISAEFVEWIMGFPSGWTDTENESI